MAATVGAYLGDVAHGDDDAAVTDVKVIATFGEAAGFVGGFELRRGEVDVRTGRRTVDD